MIAIDKQLLKNTFLVSDAQQLKEGDFITAEQFRGIKEHYPTLKTQRHWLVRLGFIILGEMLYSSIVGAISVVAIPILQQNYEVMIFVYAFIGLAGAEFFAKKDFYGYGFDDAFIIGFQILLAVAVGVNTESLLAGFFTLLITATFCCLRYINTFSALAALIGFTGFLATYILNYGVIEKLYLSFAMFFLAVGIYFGYRKLSNYPQASLYKNVLGISLIYSLILGYLSVNYLVVRELSQELMGITVVGQQDIPLAFLFYGLTFIIPVAYIIFSLRQKSRAMLIIGILAFAFSIFSIKYYYHLIPIEVALIVSGILLFAASYYCIIQLRHRESGITFLRDRYADNNALLYAQAIIVNSQINVAVNPIESPMPFGGGGFSGGGAGETY